MSLGGVTKKNPVLAILGLLAGLNILAWLGVWELSRPQILEVVFFDVGQGDAIFIQTPQRRQVLIDGGPDSAVLEKLGKEMPFWDRTIDLVILTHPEHDHLAGLLEVLKRYQIKNILWTGVLKDTAEYREWLQLIQEEKADILIARAGQQIKLTHRALLDILYPFESLAGQRFKNTNDTSIVARLVFGQTSFLFTGDASKSIEKIVLGRTKHKASLKGDVLKVGHHGSKTSTAPEFVEAVAPEIAVISAGRDNKYGHPHQEVLNILEKYDIMILRTDRDGDIKIISDGKRYAVSNIQK